MYVHLTTKSVTPMVVTGYRLRSKIRFEYGKIIIDAECAFLEDENEGELSLCIYRDDEKARLWKGELIKYINFTEAENDVRLFLRQIMPAHDIRYILSLFGMQNPGGIYERRRLTRVRIPKARKREYYDRYDLLFSMSVTERWLKTYGGLFGYRI